MGVTKMTHFTMHIIYLVLSSFFYIFSLSECSQLPYLQQTNKNLTSEQFLRSRYKVTFEKLLRQNSEMMKFLLLILLVLVNELEADTNFLTGANDIIVVKNEVEYCGYNYIYDLSPPGPWTWLRLLQLLIILSLRSGSRFRG